MKTLNVIGCGNVGRTLSRVFCRRNVVQLRSVLNRSRESGSRAVQFIESGRAVEDYAQLGEADVFMISASDGAIAECCRQLCATGLLRQGVVVFHCSGALDSSLLGPAKAQGASVASVHPVKSFADPAIAAETFAGTFCALEGDGEACEALREVLHGCGAVTFPVKPEHKTIHHVATVLVCNDLVALLEVGLRCFERAGLPREEAVKVIVPIVTGTLSNVFRLGPVQALTGPVARGELAVVQRHCEALREWDEEILGIYECLGRVAAELAGAQGRADPDALASIERILGAG